MWEKGALFMSKLTIDLTSTQHKEIKLMAVLSNQTIKDYILERALPRNSGHQLNLETLEAIAELERGEGKAFEMVKELFVDLEDEDS